MLTRKRMKFKTLLAAKLLGSKLPAEEINFLPASYQQLGEICAVKLNKNLNKYRKIIGKAILELFPKFRAVVLQKNISGEFRKPEIEVIAGRLPKEISVKENNCVFKFNPKEIMYSQGNHAEKKRMISLVKDNETVIDMFAGIGYFTIPIAKANKTKCIFAIEKNPTAFRYLQENIRINRVSVAAINDNCRNAGKYPIPVADRIIMGLIPSCKKFIPAAVKISKPGAIIHYHGLAREGEERALLNDFANFKVRLLKITIVKGFGPHVNHVVLDVSCC